MDLRTGIVLVIGIIIIICLWLLLYYSMYKEAFIGMSRHINFLSREDTARFILGDYDHYARNLSVFDLRARKSSTAHVYSSVSSMHTDDFVDSEKNILTQAAYAADAFFNSLVGEKRVPGLESHVITTLPWFLAKTTGDVYEGGFPHTRSHIIFLTDKHVHPGADLEILTRLLIHEKIHVYQRIYPTHINEYLSYINCQPHSERRIYEFIRANPDVGAWVYVCANQAELTKYEYNSTNPKGITDVKRASGMEHPFEDMAYYVASLYDHGQARDAGAGLGVGVL